jgi:hypothetical protein
MHLHAPRLISAHLSGDAAARSEFSAGLIYVEAGKRILQK